MKKLYIFLILCLSFIALTACSSKESVSTGDDEEQIGNILGVEDESQTSENTSDEEIRLHGQYPEYLRGWNDEKDDNDVIYEYKGGELSVSHKIQNGGFKSVFGICVMLDGVIQESVIINDDTNEKSEESLIHSVLFEKNVKKEFHISFTPNIGKEGEIKEISVGVFADFDAVIEEGAEFLNYGNKHDYRDVKCRRVKMLCDGSGEAKPTEVKAEKRKADKRVTDVVSNLFEEGVETAYLYTDYEKDSCGMSSVICAKSGKENTYGIDIAAPKGKYRLSLFIDHKIQTDINGNQYFDVETESGKMNHIEITLPKNELKGRHHAYVMIRNIDGAYRYDKTTTKAQSVILDFE